MTTLSDHAIDAQGGLDRWEQLSSVTMQLTTGGALWAIKGQDGVINDSAVHVVHRG